VSRFTYDVAYREERNRLTTAFRIILAIPHLIIVGAWQYLVEILAVIQWFIILFTGKRNESIWNMQRTWLAYASRVYGYVALLFDEYPAFATDAGPAPVRTSIVFNAEADRLSSALRIIWAIPALIITAVVGIAAYVVVLISWFAIVITGKHPKGMWEFTLKVLRMTLQLDSYIFLMTDTYPKFGEGAGPGEGGVVVLPPPPPTMAFSSPPPVPSTTPPPPPPPR
jgi:hypothetical protein